MLNLRSPRGLKPEGTGPMFVGLLLPLVGAAIAATVLWPGVTRFPAGPWRVPGVAWLVLGFLFWALSMRSFLPGFRRGELVTGGTFAWCRHPIYASLLMFWLPAVGLLVGTWTFYLVAAIGWPLARATVRSEENELARLFGEQWDAYTARTPALLPLPPMAKAVRMLVIILWIGFALLLVGTALRPVHPS
jgi:protein-S-isoprenylcysteine O-methyltransferase Ste14